MTAKITYQNGFIQNRKVIPQVTYNEIIKPLLNEAHQLEIDKLDKASKANKSYIKKCYGDFITDESPIFMGLHTGILELPNQQGGNQKIKIEVYES